MLIEQGCVNHKVLGEDRIMKLEDSDGEVVKFGCAVR